MSEKKKRICQTSCMWDIQFKLYFWEMNTSQMSAVDSGSAPCSIKGIRVLFIFKYYYYFKFINK